MQVFSVDDEAAQSVEPQLARWVVGAEVFVVEVLEDYLDKRLPDIARVIAGIEDVLEKAPVEEPQVTKK